MARGDATWRRAVDRWGRRRRQHGNGSPGVARRSVGAAGGSADPRVVHGDGDGGGVRRTDVSVVRIRGDRRVLLQRAADRSSAPSRVEEFEYDVHAMNAT